MYIHNTGVTSFFCILWNWSVLICEANVMIYSLSIILFLLRKITLVNFTNDKFSLKKIFALINWVRLHSIASAHSKEIKRMLAIVCTQLQSHDYNTSMCSLSTTVDKNVCNLRLQSWILMHVIASAGLQLHANMHCM